MHGYIFVGRRWKHLDEWDIPVFVAGLAAIMGVLVAAGHATADSAGWYGASGGSLAITLRRVLQPKLAEKEAGPPPPPMTIAGLVLTALGCWECS